MGIINSTTYNNIDDDDGNYNTRAIQFNSPIISRTNSNQLYDLPTQGPNINVQRTSVVRNYVNLRRKTLQIINDGNNVYLINFFFDALYDVEISIHFCCKEGFTEKRELFYSPGKYKTITKVFPKEINQMYISQPEEGINLKLFDINDLKSKPNYEYIIPILIILKAIGTPVPQAQYNYAYLEEKEIKENKKSEKEYRIVLYRQKIQFANKYFEVQEIFGIEKSNTPPLNPVDTSLSGKECVICLTEEGNTAILPCRHMCLCNTCANIIRMQNTKCPICRQGIKGLLQIAVDNKKESSIE
ncbi:RING zinc finger protein, putative [Plasmodium berghei]|uniref:RING-type E3 ubiquitin transferase n=2 Tax=Plasmodium berghei TaxID=5821 RepID=A0A509AF13_PLABA|nr:RING zinc finger protein, putative [Plasmodium berghei ANKA]CXH95857.1 RING zinc finger protein, putative [Plasmodium berghei]SCL91066.1 RING zinc finger protein, putative [Plasmodium berghei]SCM15417.1 RING zinc finger protein, putative [Plasmodium berghei]SCM17212.1 RING zinc finger protein, putative [Plasmodium berghei]SCN22286.1 RING zinc finger protein, putative [Plasmodium berghei]|eukprot:XP_034420002.1 RING zinc finger protein, putative [Plasmodium berghei ANKA]